MKNKIVLLTLMCLGSSLFGSLALFAQDTQIGHGSPEPPRAGVQWAKGEAPPTGQAPSSPNLSWHGGPVISGPGAVAEVIFWGPNWGNSAWVGDKISGIESFYRGVGGSTYAGTNTEYTGSNGSVVSSVTYSGYHLDLSTAPKNANVTSPILNEVCRQIQTPVSNGYYPVYIDNPRGHAGFCAWHSAGSCNGVPVQFAFFFNLDGDAGCDPQDTSGLHSQGMAALANVSGHELSEMLTDPRLNAWYDSGGAENADKCAWRFGTPLLAFSNGSSWKIQGNWSNNAYNSSTGYANSSGQKGCIDGGN